MAKIEPIDAPYSAKTWEIDRKAARFDWKDMMRVAAVTGKSDLAPKM